MLLRKLVVVGLVGFVSFAANIATADEAMAPNTSYAALDGVSFVEQPGEFANGGRLNLSFSDGADGPRFTNFSPSSDRAPPDRDASRGYEVALIARATDSIDVSFAQRGAMGVNQEGDISRQSRSSELRLGRGLRHGRERPSATPAWYIFAASDDEALTWRPGQRNAFGGSHGGFALQDRVEIGDMQAGVTYEVYGIQASLAYVQREISVRSGSQSFSQDEDFTGVTITMRH